MNLDSRADGHAAQLISLLEKCMHAGGVHQGNKDNEEFCLTPIAGPLPKCCLPFMSSVVYIGCMNRIQVSPEVHFGKPCVAGTRIPVQAVLELVREAIPFESIIRDYYPDLKMEDIQARIQYAIDVVQTEDIHVGVPR